MPTTPYTTRSGLRIGCHCQARPSVPHDRDALRLQRALLGEHPPIDASGLFIAVVVTAVIAIVLFAHWST